MLRTVKGALRRLTKSSHSDHHNYWCADEKIGPAGHLVTEREQRLHRLRNERPSYERFTE